MVAKPNAVQQLVFNVIILLLGLLMGYLCGKYQERQQCPYHKVRDVMQDLQNKLK